MGFVTVSSSKNWISILNTSPGLGFGVWPSYRLRREPQSTILAFWPGCSWELSVHAHPGADGRSERPRRLAELGDGSLLGLGVESLGFRGLASRV